MQVLQLPKLATKKQKEEIYLKTTKNNEKFTLDLKIKDNSIYISITFDEDHILYEDIKSYEDIQKQYSYFEVYNLEEIYDELADLISKNKFELNRTYEQILFNIILESKNIIDFVLLIKKSENNITNNTIFQQVIYQKDEIIKRQYEMLRQKDEIIRQKDLIIKSFEEILRLNNLIDDKKEKKTI